MAEDKDLIRVPGTTTLFACVLDRILREHLCILPIRHPGWTFEHNPRYHVPIKEFFYQYTCSAYIGSGRVHYLRESEEGSFAEIKFHARRSSSTNVPSPDRKLWKITVWAKTPDCDIGPHVFFYSEREHKLHITRLLPEHTPKKVDSWWKTPLKVDLNHPHKDPDGWANEALQNN